MAAISGNWLSYNVESVETDASGWGGASNVNCTLAQSTMHALDGTHSLLMTSSASGAMSTRTAASVAVPSGAQYVSFGGGVYSSNGLTCSVTLQWLDSSNNVITTTATPNLTGSGSWQYAHSGITIPSGAASVNVILNATATAASQRLRVRRPPMFHAPGSATDRAARARTPTSSTSASALRLAWKPVTTSWLLAL